MTTNHISSLIIALSSLGLNKEASLIKLAWGSEQEWRNAFKAILAGNTKVIGPTIAAMRQFDERNDTAYKEYMVSLPKDQQESLLKILQNAKPEQQSEQSHVQQPTDPFDPMWWGDDKDWAAWEREHQNDTEDEWITNRSQYVGETGGDKSQDRWYRGEDFATKQRMAVRRREDFYQHINEMKDELERGKSNINRIEGRYVEALIDDINHALSMESNRDSILTLDKEHSELTSDLKDYIEVTPVDHPKREFIIGVFIKAINAVLDRRAATITDLIGRVVDFPKRTMAGELGRFINNNTDIEKIFQNIIDNNDDDDNSGLSFEQLPKVSKELEGELLSKLTNALYHKFILKYNTYYDKPRKPMSKSPSFQEDEDSYVERWNRMDSELKDKVTIQNSVLKKFVDSVPNDSIISVLKVILGERFKELEAELNSIGIKPRQFIR